MNGLAGFIFGFIWLINILGGLALFGLVVSGIWVLLFESVSKGGAMIGIAVIAAIALRAAVFILSLVSLAIIDKGVKS